jgi:hypothetical protein
LPFNIFIKDPCNIIKHSKYWLFASEVKILRATISFDDGFLLQSDIEHVCVRCTANCVKINSTKTRVAVFARKTNILFYTYELLDSSITRTGIIKNIGIKLDSKLHFHSHRDYIFSQSVRMLDFTRTMLYSFSTLDSLLIFYLNVVTSKLEHASKVWNSIRFTDAKNLKSIQRHFVVL